jgi:L-gulonolactone oxidase
MTRAATWQNWAGNQRTDPVRTVRARDAGDVAAAIGEAARDGLRVKALGSGHSFTGVAVADGVAVLAPSDPAGLRVDSATGRAVVPAGMTLRALNELLWRHGRALPNLGDIDAQTIAGAISTGTHGTGAGHRGLAAQVVGCRIVLADGSVVDCSAEHEPELFSVARLGLGAFGVLVEVTLQTVPAFMLHAREAALPLPRVLSELDALAAENEHFEFYWFPHTDVAATKRNNRSHADGPTRGAGSPGGWATSWWATAPSGSPPAGHRPAVARAAHQPAGRRAVRRRVLRRPVLPGVHQPAPGAVRRDGVRGAPGGAARGVRRPARRRRPVRPARHVPGGGAGGGGRRRPAVHRARPRHRLPRRPHRGGQPHEAYFAAVERVMIALDGRPHWGKLHTRTAEQLRGSYPAFDAVVALRDRVDPQRRFGNPYRERVLG